MSDNSIRHVIFSEVDYFQPPVNTGGSTKLHKEISSDFMDEVVSSIKGLQKELEKSFYKTCIPYMPVVVELETKAVSKSNRPTAIFNETTCPFFGDIGFSRFLIQATPGG